MRQWLGWLALSLTLMFIISLAWTRRHHMATAAAQQAPQTDANYAEAQEAQKDVTVTGPLADYMERQKPANVETLQPISQKVNGADRVAGESPVGTSTALLHKTFGVTGIVDVPFDIPTHASSPQLRGTYRSYVKQGGAASSDSTADVEFLLMNNQQYADFLNGRPGDALFSADAAHDGEVNFTLPPTFARGARYYLVFRNGTPKDGKKLVQADFRVDF